MLIDFDYTFIKDYLKLTFVKNNQKSYFYYLTININS
jgi:hypothetical protein